MSERILFRAELPIDTRDLVLTPVACPICKTSAGNYAGRIVINDAAWHLDFCARDDVWWINPRPSGDFYGQLYQKLFYNSPIPEQFGYPTLELDGARRTEKAALNWDDIEENIPDLSRGRFLELGCATGELVQEAARRGWQRSVGIEIEENCCTLARQKGLDVVCGSFEEMEPLAEKFDLIFADNVIEHLLDPEGAVRKCGAMQPEGGHLVLRLPDTQPGGPTLKLIDHTYHFTRASITKLLTLSGDYRVEKIIHSGTFYGSNKIDRIENMTVFARKTGVPR